jgi:hypothetical protein
MTKSLSQQNSLIIKNKIIVGNLPNANSNDVLIYNKKHTEKKLKEISNSDKAEVTEITKIIAQWGYALGITVVAQDLVTLNNFIRENFPNLNIFDLKVCVRLVSVDSELLQTDAEHYGKLTLIYVSKILKAYEVYKSTICFEVGQKVLKFEEKNKPPMSKEERLKNFKELLVYAKKSAEQGEVYFDTGESIYNFIRHNKLVNIDEDLIKKAMDSGEKEFRVAVSDSKIGNLKKMINDVDFTNTKKEDLIKRGARRFVVNFWLKSMNLDGMLKKLTYEMLLY